MGDWLGLGTVCSGHRAPARCSPASTLPPGWVWGRCARGLQQEGNPVRAPLGSALALTTEPGFTAGSFLCLSAPATFVALCPGRPVAGRWSGC